METDEHDLRDHENAEQEALHNTEMTVNAENLFVGSEIHQHFHIPNQLDFDALEKSLKEELYEQNEIIYGSVDVDPIPLDVIKATLPTFENFGTSASLPQPEVEQTRYEASELLPLAQLNAADEALTRAKNQSSRDEYVKKHGNIVGVVGAAGIGKTTLAKLHLRETVQENKDAFTFYISLKDLDYSKTMSVLEFLLRSTVPYWEHSPDSDTGLLKKISCSKNVHIIMDGFDEANLDSIDNRVPKVGLFDTASPQHILMNLLGGNILPNSLKWIVSRPGAYYDLHPDYKPHFTARVIGLSNTSQELFCQKLCQSDQEFEQVQDKLYSVGGLKAVCSTPMFCSLIVPQALKSLRDKKYVLSVTGAFASAFDDCIRSDHFKGKLPAIHLLSKLALNGMLKNKFVFKAEELKDLGCDLKAAETFITLRVTKNHLRIFEGDKVFSFTHLTWQEFLAAMHLFFAASVEDLKSMLSHFTEPRWEMVLRFLYGFFDQSVFRLFSSFFPKISTEDIDNKKELLKNSVVTAMQKFAETGISDYPEPLHQMYTSLEFQRVQEFRNRPSDTTLFKMCTFAMESNDDHLTREIAASLPSTILLSRIISESDVACLCHVLGAADRAITFNVGSMYSFAVFVPNGLKSFLQFLSGTKHKIAKFHTSATPVGGEHVGYLEKYIADIETLTIRHCDIDHSVLAKIVDCIEHRKTPLGCIDFTLTGIDAKLLSRCVGHVERILHHGYPIPPEGMQVLVSRIKGLKQPLKWLQIALNQLGTVSAALLGQCLENIEMLWLTESDIDCDAAEFESVFTAIGKLKTPLQLLSLGGNKIGRKGFVMIAKCLHNIQRLKIYYCDMKDADYEALAHAIAALKIPMKELNISNNYVGTTAMRFLCLCVHNIEALNLNDCGVTDGNFENLLNQTDKLATPMKWLCIRSENMSDVSAEVMSRHLHKFENIWVSRSCFTKAGVQTITDALRLEKNKTCKVHGLETEL